MTWDARRGDHADVVILGGGVAGLSALLAAAGLDILVIHPPGDFGSSELAAGGIAASLDEDGTSHVNDTCAAGAGHCDRRRVELLVSEGRTIVDELVESGMPFDRTPQGALAFGLEAGHSRPRIVHAGGDATGRALVRFLGARAQRQARVRRLAGVAAGLTLDDEGRVAAVTFRDPAGRLGVVRAPHVILATGGVGGLFDHTSNRSMARGDGIALALAAGASVMDLEFIQFHPTALDIDVQPMPLITEAIRGAGAVLIDGDGRRIMAGVHPAGDLAPRDVVSRAVWSLRSAGQPVFLDTRAVDGLDTRFPSVAAICARLGVDRTRIPVTPAAHFHMGGVAVDDDGATEVEGLWACGEVACTGVHGANRLASNSLLEALVFGRRVGRALLAREGTRRGRPRSLRESVPRTTEHAIARGLDGVFWRAFGVERDGAAIRDALEQLEAAASVVDAASDLGHRVLLGRLIGRACLAREESRGAHYRVDHPGLASGTTSRIRARLLHGEVRLDLAPASAGPEPRGATG